MERYQSFSQSFVDIDDPQIAAALMDEGKLKTMWPEPLVQFNPAFEPGASVESLVKERVLEPAMASIYPPFVPSTLQAPSVHRADCLPVRVSPPRSDRPIDFDGLPSRTIDETTYPLYPVVFNRSSGKPFLCVEKNLADGKLEARDFSDDSLPEEDRDSREYGYLLCDEQAWKPEEDLVNLPAEYTREVGAVLSLLTHRCLRGRALRPSW